MSDSVAPTVDAHISAWEEGKDFTIVPEVKGESVDKAKVQTAINAAIASGMTEIDLEALGCYTPLQVTSGDASLKALCAQMNQAKSPSISVMRPRHCPVLNMSAGIQAARMVSLL
mgnify:CR=1 FL=1